MENDTLKEYLRVFNNFPPLIKEFPYNNETYIVLMEKAILNNKPITEKDIADFIKKFDIKYGDVEDNFDPDEEEDYE